MPKYHFSPESKDWHKETIRVRYADTDRMGVVYHANYLIYFEACRSSLIRKLWKPYAEIEQDGYLLLVIEAHCRYRKGAQYDDLLDVYARVSDFSDTRIRFEYRVLSSSEGTLLVEGSTEHCFTNRDGKPRRMPGELKAILTKMQQ
jgi:acyl-CoA thioester hydrolase